MEWKTATTMTPVTATSTHAHHRIFMIRVWSEEADSPSTTWRGKVQSLPDGEAYHFCTWSGLIAHLQSMVESGYSDNMGSEPVKGDVV